MREERVRSEQFDGESAWRVTSPDGASALIAARGATLLSWKPKPGVEVIDGYRSAAELVAAESRKNLIEAPWVGVVDSGAYRFDGATYEVGEHSELGLVSDVEFKGKAAGDALLLKARVGGTAAYPWPLDISVIFALEAGGTGAEAASHLSVSIEVRNAGDSDAPVAIGWRPSVHVPGVKDIANVELRIPARTRLASDRRGVPIPGDAALTGVASPVVYSYLGREDIHDSFTSLIPEDDGVVLTSAVSVVTGRRVELTQEPSEAPYVRVEADGADAAASLVLAPSSTPVNALNRYDQAVRLRLAPGRTRGLTATLTIPAK